MRILVTGATGFIGSAVVARLLEEGRDPERIHLLQRRPLAEDSLVHERLKESSFFKKIQDLNQHIVDFSNERKFRELLSSGDLPEGEWTVIHLAAMIHAKGKRELQRRLNEGVTEDLCHWAKAKNAHMIFSSSVVAFGGTLLPFTRDESAFDRFPFLSRFFSYFTSKRRAHEKLWSYREVFPVSVLCPAIVHGKFENRKDSRAHIKAIIDGRLTWAPPGGGNLVSLDDVVHAIVEESKKRPDSSGHLRLLVGQNMMYQDYFQLLSDAFSEKKARIKRIPLILVWLFSPVLLLLSFFGVAFAEGLLQGSFFLYFRSKEAAVEPKPVGVSLGEAFGNES